MGKLRFYWNYVRSSLWFLPLWIILGAVVGALGLIELDQNLHDRLVSSWPRLFASGPEGSQAMLSAIASSMITVAGVVFSITILALAQASTQYSPRVLRNFMRDRSNQTVLGVFVGVYVYCLVVLRNITWETKERAIPSLAIFVAFVLAVVAIGFLIYFIHHIAESIQASRMTHSITEETLQVIKRLFPKRSARAEDSARQEGERLAGDGNWHIIPALTLGYVQAVETDRLVALAKERKITIQMELGIGEFAIAGRALARVCGCGPPDKKMVKDINLNYAIGAHRTIEQDPEFGVQQLSDIAVKALSPGINDASTAATAVDYLCAILCELAPRTYARERYYYVDELKLIARGSNFETMMDTALQGIIENSGGSHVVVAHLLLLLRRVALTEGSEAYHAPLLKHAQSVADLVPGISVAAARARLQKEIEDVFRCIRNSEGCSRSKEDSP